MNKKISTKISQRLIADNRKARHDYDTEQRFEAGIVLKGWEVKSIRAGRIQLRDSHVIFKNKEAWLIGAHISPLPNVPAYLDPSPQRSRKLLLTAKELGKLFGAVQKKGYTVIPLNFHWRKQHIKAEVALGKGKKTHDKRQSIKEREWHKEQHRVLKTRRNQA